MSDIERVLHRLKLSDLRLLQAVVARGGMAKAATQLNISQPAVSKAISGSFKRMLGVKLLDRLSSGVMPTAYGEALLRGSLNVFDDLKQSLREFEFIADASVGEVPIGPRSRVRPASSRCSSTSSCSAGRASMFMSSRQTPTC